MRPDSAHPHPTVLLLGNYRPTITLVRALKPHGYRTVVGLGGGEGGAEYSRFTDELWSHPVLGDRPEPFLTALESFLRQRPDVGVVFPVAEDFVRVVSAARDRLPPDRLYAIPSPEVIDASLDKLSGYAIARAAGIPVAPYVQVETLPDLGRQCADIGYPVVLRPIDSTRRLGGRKALIIRSASELARTVPVWPAGQSALLVQRWVPGHRHNTYFAARAGRILRIVETVISRTDDPDGTGLAVEGRSVPLTPELTRFTERLAAELRYTGIGLAQFLVDATAGIHFVELNPRVAGSHAIAEATGLELGLLSVVLAAPDAPDVPSREGRPGITYVWTYGDLRGLMAALRARRISGREAMRWAGSLLRAAARGRVHMTWRWDDPLPTLVLYARQLPLVKYLVRRSVRLAPRLETVHEAR